eukprot:scaffold317543_cov25-Prasinocladus_malaysianus.AAC.1
MEMHTSARYDSAELRSCPTNRFLFEANTTTLVPDLLSPVGIIRGICQCPKVCLKLLVIDRKSQSQLFLSFIVSSRYEYENEFTPVLSVTRANHLNSFPLIFSGHCHANVIVLSRIVSPCVTGERLLCGRAGDDASFHA